MVATAYGELTSIITGSRGPPAVAASPDNQEPPYRVGVFVSEVVEDCRPTCGDSSIVNIRTMNGNFRTWDGEGSPIDTVVSRLHADRLG